MLHSVSPTDPPGVDSAAIPLGHAPTAGPRIEPSDAASTSSETHAHRPAPIRVCPKPKRRRKSENVFLDERGYPDQSDEFDKLLHNVDGGTILRKRKHAAPPLNDIDPAFASPYVEAKHGERLRKELDVSHLEPSLQTAVTDLIKKYWSVFDDKGLFVPVKDYECVIDTGIATPIAVKKIHYGPRETPIMRKCIAALAKLGHIRQINDGGWLFKALLAPKPHQEHISDIADFVWRFCVNFIPLNRVTKVIAYPIPRCDSAVSLSFGASRLFWLFDAPQGYHQISVAKESQEKLAFAGPDATKWCYNVMPFGPVNGPAVFIMFIHDLDCTWKALAKELGVSIDDDTNSNIIVDDILSWAKEVRMALLYMECQLRVCLSQNLSLSLKKTFIFPKRFEFVGTDVTLDGNRPAMSKHELLKTWPQPVIVRDIAKFVGFILFYSRYITHCEIRLEPLRDLMQHEYTESLEGLWTDKAQASMDDLKKSVLDDPCLKRYDHRKLLVLMTDFSAKGFGYVACQPADDAVSLAAMAKRVTGGSFEFLKAGSDALLHPVAFGGRRTKGNETKLHSHLGEGFSGDWSINKCRHMCFGQRFTWVTDCYAIRFILSYDGKNPAILRLQMRFMCWDMDIEHRKGELLAGPDYFSRLEADLCFDPLLKDYIERAQELKRQYPTASGMPMQPENMPYYRPPRVTLSLDEPAVNFASVETPALDREAQDVFTAIVVDHSHGLCHLSNCPIRFGNFAEPIDECHHPKVLYNADIPAAARRLLQFDWAVYGFNSGHFVSTIRSRNLPFNIVLASDPYAASRALFKEFAPDCDTILNGAAELLDHIRGSGRSSVIHGYLIHSHRYPTSAPTKKFWEIQAAIVIQLRRLRSLSIFVAVIHPDHDGRAVELLRSKLKADGWILSLTNSSFTEFGDSVAGDCRLLIGVHSATDSDVKPLELKTPPAIVAPKLAHFLWAPFNRKEFALSFGRDDPSFNKDSLPNSSSLPLVASTPKSDVIDNKPAKVSILYNLHPSDSEASVCSGSSVFSLDSFCPAFDSAPNSNIFQQYFGIEFKHLDHTYVRAISPFEFVSCHGLVNDLTYRLSKPEHKYSMDAAVPAMTSAWLFDHILDRLISIRDANCEIYDAAHHAAPALTIQAFLGGAIGVRLPTRERWVQAYSDDGELKSLAKFVLNPHLITTKHLTSSGVHHAYRGALRRSLIVIEDGMLIFREPI